MSGDPRVRGLVEEILETHRTPEEVCQACPELLPEVRDRLRRLRELEAQVDSLFPTPGSATGPVEPPDGRLPQIPGYDVQAILGRGGMGVVYKARHLRLNRVVALKMLQAGAYAGPHERARFQREAEAVASLRHPNIVAGLRRGRPRGVPVFHDGAPRRGQPGAGPGGHAAAGPPGGRAPGHAGRGRAGGAPGRDRAPRPEAGQHPAHGRGHAQGRRFRAGAAL